MEDGTKIEGTFRLRVIDSHGKLLQEIAEKNLVVNGGRNSAARLLGGGGTNKEVTQIGFGTSATLASPPDSALTGAFVKDIDTASYPQTGAVQFDWVLDYAEANGLAIREFGLLSADDTLFSRKVRDLITKTVDIRLEGSWTIQY